VAALGPSTRSEKLTFTCVAPGACAFKTSGGVTGTITVKTASLLVTA
jgi:hypothetical protein